MLTWLNGHHDEPTNFGESCKLVSGYKSDDKYRRVLCCTLLCVIVLGFVITPSESFTTTLMGSASPQRGEMDRAASGVTDCSPTCSFLKAVVKQVSIDLNTLRGTPIASGTWKGQLQPPERGECVVTLLFNEIPTYQCKMGEFGTNEEAQKEYSVLTQALSVALGPGWTFREEKLFRSWRYEATEARTEMKVMVLVMDLRTVGGSIRVDMHVLPNRR